MLPIFLNSKLFSEALTHRSLLNERKGIKSNERLEFLGDAVLELATTKYLYHRYPEAAEGLLTSYRAALVKRSMLAQVAQELGIDDQLLLSHGEEAAGGRKNPALLENTFEAIVGALYLDQGFEACESFLEKQVFTKAQALIDNNLIKDYKSNLQESIQSQGKETPTYSTIEAIGPDHNKTFTVAVLSEGKEIGRGTGRSKQEASQAAAKAALEILNTA